MTLEATSWHHDCMATPVFNRERALAVQRDVCRVDDAGLDVVGASFVQPCQTVRRRYFCERCGVMFYTVEYVTHVEAR